MQYLAFSVGIQGIIIGSPVVPFEIVNELPQLVLDNVEVTAIGPIVPEVRLLESSAVAVVDE